jgi:hypothetical protein
MARRRKAQNQSGDFLGVAISGLFCLFLIFSSRLELPARQNMNENQNMRPILAISNRSCSGKNVLQISIANSKINTVINKYLIAPFLGLVAQK